MIIKYQQVISKVKKAAKKRPVILIKENISRMKQNVYYATHFNCQLLMEELVKIRHVEALRELQLMLNAFHVQNTRLLIQMIKLNVFRKFVKVDKE